MKYLLILFTVAISINCEPDSNLLPVVDDVEYELPFIYHLPAQDAIRFQNDTMFYFLIKPMIAPWEMTIDFADKLQFVIEGSARPKDIWIISKVTGETMKIPGFAKHIENILDLRIMANENYLEVFVNLGKQKLDLIKYPINGVKYIRITAPSGLRKFRHIKLPKLKNHIHFPLGYRLDISTYREKGTLSINLESKGAFIGFHLRSDPARNQIFLNSWSGTSWQHQSPCSPGISLNRISDLTILHEKKELIIYVERMKICSFRHRFFSYQPVDYSFLNINIGENGMIYDISLNKYNQSVPIKSDN